MTEGATSRLPASDLGGAVARRAGLRAAATVRSPGDAHPLGAVDARASQRRFRFWCRHGTFPWAALGMRMSLEGKSQRLSGRRGS
jgi:hypothetical protein